MVFSYILFFFFRSSWMYQQISSLLFHFDFHFLVKIISPIFKWVTSNPNNVKTLCTILLRTFSCYFKPYFFYFHCFCELKMLNCCCCCTHIQLSKIDQNALFPSNSDNINNAIKVDFVSLFSSCECVYSACVQCCLKLISENRKHI